jgi:hypothetical protein
MTIENKILPFLLLGRKQIKKLPRAAGLRSTMLARDDGAPVFWSCSEHFQWNQLNES